MDKYSSIGWAGFVISTNLLQIEILRHAQHDKAFKAKALQFLILQPVH